MAKKNNRIKLDGIMGQGVALAHIKVLLEKGLAQFDESGIPSCGDPDCHLCPNIDWNAISEGKAAGLSR